ncbi:MAG: hypothetical protein J7M32_07485 [Deltaproteobacteria bacterium]|nr:hypothetical protein [Deltaproteobacteria bacterium]
MTYLRGALVPCSILDFVELRLLLLISQETRNPPEGWGLNRAKKRRGLPGSRVRKTLLPLFIELLRLNPY